MSNYAFKPIAEQVLGPNQTVVPQRLNAALEITSELNMRLLPLLVFSAGFAASTNLHSAENVADFVPGEKMVFPMRSAGVATDLASMYLVNCNSKDTQITQACELKVRIRGTECGPNPPEVFESKEEYKSWAMKFSSCIFEKPICGGVEVSTEQECKAAME